MDEPPRTGTPRPGRRSWSLWTILAPLAAIVLWVAFFAALGDSCVIKDCSDEGVEKVQEDQAAVGSDLKKDARYRVREGDTLSKIAAQFGLTQEELRGCNTTVDAQTLQPGQFLFVSPKRCKGADLAEVGANPDPLAGDTNAATGDGADAAGGDAANQDDDDATGDGDVQG